MSGPRLRIVHVDKFASRSGGGAPSYLLDLVERQRTRGHEVDFLSTEGDVDTESKYRHLFPPRIVLDPPPSGVMAKLSTAGTMIWSKRAAQAMDEVLSDFEPDVVHCHNLYHQLSPSVLQPVRRRRIRTVLTVHDYKLVCPTYRLVDGHGQHCEACVSGSVLNVVRRRCQGGSRAQSAVLMLESGTHRRLNAYGPVGTFLCPSRYLAGLLGRSRYGSRALHLPLGYDVTGVTARERPGSGVVYGGRLSPEKGSTT